MTAAAECHIAEQLEAFSSGRLDETEADAIADHLSICSNCVAALQQLSPSDTLIDARAQTILIDPPADAERIQKIIRAAKQLCTSSNQPLPEFSEQRVPAYEIDNLKQLAEFRLIKLLGQGGMGVVFEAEDTHLQRRVAVKALRPEHAANPHARLRFLREARAIARLEHENIVPILLIGEDKGVPYFVMPLLAGESLETKRRREGKLSLPEILRIGIAVADGLDASHRRGIVHRDVKPENVWLETKGSCPLPDFHVKLLDFGLAYNEQQDDRLTQEGMLIGTPAFMSPEQANGLPSDARGDLFSLGTLLYFLASGKLPFTGSSAVATLRAVAHQPAAPLADLCPDLPGAFVAIIEKLHAKDPAHRFAAAGDVAAELRRIPLADDRTVRVADIPVCQLERQTGMSATRRTVLSRHGRRRWQTLVAGLLLLAVAGLGICEAAGITRVMQSLKGSGQASLPPTIVDVPSAPNDSLLQPIAVENKVPAVFPVALLEFEERGTAGVAPKVANLLFAKLADNPGIYLVDRTDLHKVMAEASLNLSGAVKSSEAIQLGQITGAKLLVTGSVVQDNKKIILIAKVIGTETGRVVGVSVEGKANDDLSELVGQLAMKLGEIIPKKADDLVAKRIEKKDRIAAVNEKMKKGIRPVVLIHVDERHVGLPKIDPAAQTELTFFCKETGFTVIDDEEGTKGQADFIIKGEGMSETAARHGNLVTVGARVEVKAVDRKTGKVIAVDRQTVVVVELTELIAGKTALQEAAAQVAERMLPKLVKP